MRLRWRCAIVAVCCCVAVGVNETLAQPDTALNVSIGLHGEYGFTSLSVRPYAATHGGKRFGGGVSVRLDNSKIFGANIELNYAASSHRVVEKVPRPFNEQTFTPGEQECQQRWLELPIIAEIGYRFPMWRVYALGGGYADFLLAEKFGAKGALQRQQVLFSTHYRFGGGLVGGAGVGIETRYGALIFEYRAAVRLVNLYKRTLESGIDILRQRLSSQSFGLSYYYTFTVRKKERNE